MKRDPWTDPDPQPEDFARWFAEARPEDIEVQYFDGHQDGRAVYIGNEDPDEYIKRKRAERARNGTGGGAAAASSRR